MVIVYMATIRQVILQLGHALTQEKADHTRLSAQQCAPRHDKNMAAAQPGGKGTATSPLWAYMGRDRASASEQKDRHELPRRAQPPTCFFFSLEICCSTMVISRSTRSMFWMSSSLDSRAGSRSSSASGCAGLTGDTGSSLPGRPRSWGAQKLQVSSAGRLRIVLSVSAASSLARSQPFKTHTSLREPAWLSSTSHHQHPVL